jgi:hypothetical protein
MTCTRPCGLAVCGSDVTDNTIPKWQGCVRYTAGLCLQSQLLLVLGEVCYRRSLQPCPSVLLPWRAGWCVLCACLSVCWSWFGFLTCLWVSAFFLEGGKP